jgi:hypothetical protein
MESSDRNLKIEEECHPLSSYELQKRMRVYESKKSLCCHTTVEFLWFQTALVVGAFYNLCQVLACLYVNDVPFLIFGQQMSFMDSVGAMNSLSLSLFLLLKQLV